MKMTVKGLGIIVFAAMLVFLLAVCNDPEQSHSDSVINIAAIQGVTIPVTGATPVTTITENAQYSGTVTWNGSSSTFAANTQYIATITLIAKTGYTLQGVAANLFTVAGATSISNAANSGVVTAVFPPSTNVINIAAIQGVIVPANGLTPVTAITENEQYSGTVTWNDNPSTFAASTVYTATITLTPKTGYTLQGITANFFTVTGATSVINVADSGVITALFPVTDSRLVTNIVIKTQPTKLTYTHGDPLDLAGLVVTLIYNNGSTDEVNAVYFPIKSITTDPRQGNNLDNSIHNGQPIKISYGNLMCNTGNLIINLNPTADDFKINGTGSVYYDGSPKTITIIPNEGKSGGIITVKYNGNTTAPSAVGTYIVTFDVAAATGFNSASGLSAGTMIIEKATPVASDFNISGIGTFDWDGNPKTVTITPKEGKSDGNITVIYNGSTTAPSAGGIYTVTFNMASTTNYNAVNGLSAGTLTISIDDVEMVQIPGGSFEMGNNSGKSDEKPVHTVTLSGFYMGKYEVTQEQWTAVMGNNPSSFTSSPASGEVQNKRPVESVSWYKALVFCNKLSILQGLNPAYRISGSTDPANWGAVPNDTWSAVEIVAGSNGYRLPTEAQWEYAVRGGNGSPGNYAYSGSDTVGDVAWYSDNSGSKTHEVGKKAPNGLGLYDMSGNVSEWCWDWYGSYPSVAQTDPMGASSGSYRVVRGGSWNYSAGGTRSTYRDYCGPNYRDYGVGFRLVRP